MKVSKIAGIWGWVCLALVASLLAGCKTGAYDPIPDMPGSGTAPAGVTAVTTPNAPMAAPGAPNGGNDYQNFRPGDMLSILFSDLPGTPSMVPYDQRIKEDGTITLSQNLTFVAVGKTRRQLEAEIHETYVPKYFKTLTVAVDRQRESQFYYVGGEVKAPGRQLYISRIFLLGALKSAGDFTDYANRKKVRLTRANGQIFLIDCKKALKDPTLDLEVYPGDNINVPRRYNPFSF